MVFDEASQITVATAVGALGRANSAVICGDTRQMPPTSFADLAREDEVANEGVADEESILSECVAAQVPRHWLTWHYRSQVESLIAFSNQTYYEGKLSSFPSLRPEGLGTGGGVSLRRVEGRFIRTKDDEGDRRLLRTNPIEADAVVTEVLSQFAKSKESNPSIGVITFNIQQRDLIESRLRSLDNARITSSLDEPNGVFVKNLENVQGDERDCILFSTAFSPDTNGKVPLNFGPLNRDGGERRLNVAITRARRQVVVFCSFDPPQLEAARSQSRGLNDLRTYLDLASKGFSGELLKRSGADGSVDRHRRDIANALTQTGLVVEENVGMSDFRIDLVVRDRPGSSRVLGVLLDGLPWAYRDTVYDREALPTLVLEGAMGWAQIERVWMPEWLSDQQGVVARLTAVIAALPPEVPKSPTVPTAEEVPPSFAVPSSMSRVQKITSAGFLGEKSLPELHESAEIDGERSSPIPTRSQMRDQQTDDDGKVRPFQEWNRPGLLSREVLDSAGEVPDNRLAIQQLAREVLKVEWPIHISRMTQLVANSCGLSRVHATRAQQVQSIIKGQGMRRDRQQFYWPSDVDPTDLLGYRTGALDYVDIAEIHPRELTNLAVHALSELPADTPDDEVRRAMVAQLSSGSKKMTARLQAVLTKALQQGRRQLLGVDPEEELSL